MAVSGILAPASRRRQMFRLFAIATVIGGVSFSQSYFAFRAEGTAVELHFILLWSVPVWYCWAAVAPLIAWLGRAAPIGSGRMVVHALVHAAAAVLLGLAISTVVAGLLFVTHGIPSTAEPAKFFPALAIVAGWQVMTNLLSYGTILGGSYAVDFYRRYREREMAASRLSEQLANAQLRALRMQLNPHFLFNAMNTVAMMVRKQENTAAVRTLAELSDLLRYVLEDTRTQEVPLRREIEFIRRYLEIEQIRFHDRLTLHIDVPVDTVDALVPNLILQPLAENAIRHGVAKSGTGSFVEITARREDRTLRLEVRDNGPGLPTIPTTAGGGLGVHNTVQRLQQLYGTEQSFNLRSVEGGGTVAIVTLPFHTETGVESDV